MVVLVAEEAAMVAVKVDFEEVAEVALIEEVIGVVLIEIKMVKVLVYLDLVVGGVVVAVAVNLVEGEVVVVVVNLAELVVENLVKVQGAEKVLLVVKKC